MQQCKQLLPLPSLSHSVFTVSPVSETPGTSGQATDKLPSSGGTSCQVVLSLRANDVTSSIFVIQSALHQRLTADHGFESPQYKPDAQNVCAITIVGTVLEIYVMSRILHHLLSLLSQHKFWNSLPANLRSDSSLIVFKNKIKTLLFKEALNNWGLICITIL